jgi:hypothetical protein
MFSGQVWHNSSTYYAKDVLQVLQESLIVDALQKNLMAHTDSIYSFIGKKPLDQNIGLEKILLIFGNVILWPGTVFPEIGKVPRGGGCASGSFMLLISWNMLRPPCYSVPPKNISVRFPFISIFVGLLAN